MKIPKHLQEKLRHEQFGCAKDYSEKLFLESPLRGIEAEADFAKGFEVGYEFLWKQLSGVVEALEFYAGMEQDKPNYKSKWVNHVCDSYSGLVSAFDWDGSIQDEPWEKAREALKRLRGDE